MNFELEQDNAIVKKKIEKMLTSKEFRKYQAHLFSKLTNMPLNVVYKSLDEHTPEVEIGESIVTVWHVIDDMPFIVNFRL